MPINKKKELINFIVAVAMSAACYYLSTGFNNVWILTWIAPIPVLIYALESSAILTLIAAFAAYFLGTFSWWPYSYTAIPYGVFLYLNLINSIAFTILVLLFRYAALRAKVWWTSFIFAAGWTLFEFIRMFFSTGGTFGSLAYTQMFNLPILQIASVSGIWGISFLLTLIPASIALAWHFRKVKGFVFKALLLSILLLIISLLFGWYRLATPLKTPSVKVGIAAIHVNSKHLFSNRLKDKKQVLTKYAESAKILAQKGVTAILFPEEIMILNQQDKGQFLDKFATIAKSNKIYLVAGVRVMSKGIKFHNSAFMFSPQGKLLLRYNKQHPVPGFEDNMIRGKELAILKTKNMGIWGVGVCKDMDFINPARKNGRAGVNIIFAPALDFIVDDWVHGRLAIMRGVENGFAIARAGQQGLLTLTDSRGRIVGLASTRTNKDQTLLVRAIHIGAGRSAYSIFGDWFAWLCLVIFGLLFFWGLFKRAK